MINRDFGASLRKHDEKKAADRQAAIDSAEVQRRLATEDHSRALSWFHDVLTPCVEEANVTMREQGAGFECGQLQNLPGGGGSMEMTLTRHAFRSQPYVFFARYNLVSIRQEIRPPQSVRRPPVHRSGPPNINEQSVVARYKDRPINDTGTDLISEVLGEIFDENVRHM